MPREQRIQLAAKLNDFAALTSSEKAAIRALDDQLRKLPEAERASYYAVLRRYHLWVKSLSDAQRAELSAAPPEKRRSLVDKFRHEKWGLDMSSASPLALTDFGAASAYDLATSARTWFNLSEPERSAVSRIKDPQARTRRMGELMAAKKVERVARPTLTKEQEKALFTRASGMSPRLDAALKRDEQMNPDEQMKPERRLRLLEHAYFLDQPPKKVDSENLYAFDAALPSWIRGMIDPLPPEEARRRLTILYRLVFPPGHEFAEAKTAPTPKKGTGPVDKKGASGTVPRKPAAPAGPY